MTALLVVVALGFAYSMGAHYTGACMGMPHALNAISARGALVLMAPLALLGATFASHGVEHTVAHELLTGGVLSVGGFVIVVGIAFGLTSAFNAWRLPTSTIQILVFTAVGAGLGAGLGVRWSTVGVLAVIWVAAPPVAAVLGYLLTRALDTMLRAPSGAHEVEHTVEHEDAHEDAHEEGGWLGVSLVAVGALASFAMGGNDVANATGSLVATRTFSPLVAGLVGGAALAAGVLTWGRPLLRRVAFEIVTLDRSMATAAQLVQAAVVLCAVAFGFFTSMNQALIGAMSGAGMARGRRTVHVAALLGVVRGWVIGPGAGIALGYGIARLVDAAAGAHALVVAAI